MLLKLSLILATLAALAAEVPDSPLAIRALAITEPDGQAWRVNVSVGNRSQATIREVKVSVLPVGATTWDISTLAPGEWKTNVIALNAGKYRSLAVIVAYSTNGRVDSISELIQMREPERPWWTSTASSAVPVALGAVVGLLGAFVTSRFSLDKERLAARLQWSRFLVEHYDVAYRT